MDMRMWQIFFFSAISIFARAQDSNEFQLINAQVWEPFIKAFNGYQTRDFMALHTEDVIRVSRGNKQIMVGTEYRKSQFRGNAISRSRDFEREIDLRFIDRLVQGNVAYEVGYYRLTVRRPAKEADVYYGLFHVTLKKVEGKWRIYIDSDEGLELTEEEFNAAKRLSDY